MKEQIKQIISETPDRLQARSRVREYLQARILLFLQENGIFRSWIFHGGTALRFLFMIPRHSEGLDFALETTDIPPDFAAVISNIHKSFEAEAYCMEVKIKEDKTAKSAFIRFPGLLHELGLSPHQTEILAIKIEVDCNPPAEGITETTIIRRFVVLNILHYDKASMLSGKLNAILARPYTKGRDLYDLFWYLSDPEWPAPNIRFLNAGLRQSRWDGPEITEANWRLVFAEKIERIDWQKVIQDVSPFIERTPDLEMLTKEHTLKLLKIQG